MSITRQKAIESAIGYHDSSTPVAKENHAEGYFGCNVFGWDCMREHLSAEAYAKLMKTVEQGETLDLSAADEVAAAMSSWAIKRGATHYAHVFYPLTGLTAEKHDSFFDPDRKGHLLANFTGKQLIQGESDASSFPNGGIRATFEARGYTAWDVTSPAYLIESKNGITLCIPTAFCSWTGDALDKKVPLLRSMQALNKQSRRVLALLGHEDPGVITASAGPEQEYFLIDRSFYYARPDLLSAGRTLFGTKPPKGQELDDQYYGAIPERVLAFMQEVDRELYRLGVPVKTRHNEVAPGQYEIAPVFESANLATDHQYLIMQTLQRIAPKYNLACLLHEKPFNGINGSGKHVNWSIGSDRLGNLLSPGDTPQENMQFLLFCAAAIRAVDLHAPMLRASVASAGNDCRLGANEAPPAVISVFLGDQLTEVFMSIARGTAGKSKKAGVLNVGVDILPKLPKDATDRNRTSPFAFTGNRFEFRAPGSSQSIAGPIVILNTIMAESLDYIACELEKQANGERAQFNTAVQKLLRKIIREHGRVIFNGDNYSTEWVDEARRRGLPSAENTPEALNQMECEETFRIMEKHGVLSRREMESRLEIYREKYCKDMAIEASLCLTMARTMIFPAGVRYQHMLAKTAVALATLGKSGCTTTLDEINAVLSQLQQAMLALEEALPLPAQGIKEQCGYITGTILPLMNKVREEADALERICADDIWTLPTYQEMLFIR